uniref:Putative ovule protein n=1 Tax=Solanum chacoense TaxID=4108 RepID=A0A0V0HMC2_SOLCH
MHTHTHIMYVETLYKLTYSRLSFCCLNKTTHCDFNVNLKPNSIVLFAPRLKIGQSLASLIENLLVISR